MFTLSKLRQVMNCENYSPCSRIFFKSSLTLYGMCVEIYADPALFRYKIIVVKINKYSIIGIIITALSYLWSGMLALVSEKVYGWYHRRRLKLPSYIICL